MYKKKLGVRVVTAITVGSLLCSNASVAMAAEEVSSIIKEHTADEETTEAPEEEVTEAEEVVEETTEAETEEVVEETTEADSSIIKEHTADEETTEAPEEEVTEAEEVVEETTEAETEEVVEETTEAETEEVVEETTEAETEEVPEEEVTEAEEVVEETTEAETEEVVEETTEAETEEVVEETTEAETEEVVEETTEAEADEEELENDFEEVELEAVETPAVAETSERLLADVAAETREVYVSLIDADDKTAVGAPQKIDIGIKDTTFPTSKLELPEEYEFAYGDGDVYVGEGTSVNVEVRKKASTEETREVYVSLIDADDKTAVGAPQKIEIGAKDTTFHTSKLALPENYEFVYGDGDVYVGEGDTVNVEVRKKASTEETRKVYVSLIDADDKTAVGAPQEIEIGAEDTTFHTSKLTLPEDYEFAYGDGDVYIGEGDTVNVEVRKKAEATEKTVHVSYIDEETKMPFENGIEEIKVAADATSFNTSILTAVPAGYELCAVGDVYIGENDTVNVEVRKVVTERTVYVSYFAKQVMYMSARTIQ